VPAPSRSACARRKAGAREHVRQPAGPTSAVMDQRDGGSRLSDRRAARPAACRPTAARCRNGRRRSANPPATLIARLHPEIGRLGQDHARWPAAGSFSVAVVRASARTTVIGRNASGTCPRSTVRTCSTAARLPSVPTTTDSTGRPRQRRFRGRRSRPGRPSTSCRTSPPTNTGGSARVGATGAAAEHRHARQLGADTTFATVHRAR